MTTNQQTTLRVAGIVGVVGTFLIWIADLAAGIQGMFGVDFWAGLIGRSGLRLGVAAYFGIFFFPFWLGGLWVLYQGLKPAGKWWSLVPVALLAYFLNTINAFLHSSYLYFATVATAQSTAIGDTQTMLLDILETFSGYQAPIGVIFLAVYAILTIWVAIPIFRGKTHFPCWLGLFNPLIFVLVSILLRLTAPALWEIFNILSHPSFAMMVLFGLATGYLWNKKLLDG